MQGYVKLSSEQMSQKNLTEKQVRPLTQGVMIWSHSESTQPTPNHLLTANEKQCYSVNMD